MKSELDITLRIWRQAGPTAKGAFKEYTLKGISPDASFLEMLDILNSELEHKGDEPVVFDHDCREGICGACGMVINGRPHGPVTGITTCQLHMRHFKDGDTITVEPWRAKAFPVIKDLMVDRSALDIILRESGYVTVNTGNAVDANAIPIKKETSNTAMDAATCIGCGACVASCKNASAMLFVSAKVSHLALLPQGHPERKERAKKMVNKMDELGFGNCSNTYACEADCPKEISVSHIARMNREFLKAGIS